MSKKTKIDNTIGMAEEKESLLSRNPFPDECIIEIKQHSSKFLFMHLLPSSNFPLIFSFIHPTDLPQIMWVNKTFREDSRRYIKNLTSYQKISISQEITQSTVETMKKITEDFKEYFCREAPDLFIRSHDLKFEDPGHLLPLLITSTSRELDTVKQLLGTDRHNEKKNRMLLRFTALGLLGCGALGLWTTFFMLAARVAPLTLKIVASSSGGSIVTSSLPALLSICPRITRGCSRYTPINFRGYNLWNEDAMRLRRAVAYLRLLDGEKYLAA